MPRPFHDFDHLMCGSTDIEAAGRTFARIGFNVGPITMSGRSGCRNRRILFTPPFEGSANYLELIQYAGPRSAAMPLLQNFLAMTESGQEGVCALIMSTHAPEAAHAHFERLHQINPNGGFKPDPLMVVDYVSEGPDGKPIPIAFTNCILPHLRPPYWTSLSQIRSWGYHTHPAWCSHPNSAKSIVGVIAVAQDPQAVADYYVDLWGGQRRQLGDGVVAMGPGRIPIMIHSREAFANRFPTAEGRDGSFLAGYVITVESMSTLTDILTAQDVPHTLVDGRAVMAPQDAHGHLIVFIAHGADATLRGNQPQP
jgi:Glyoxalase-like domain